MRVQKTHPLFPTHEEIAENPELLYSDHLPVLFDVPVDSETNTNLRVISWNILGHNAPSGFHTKMRGWEEPEEKEKRFKRIIQSLNLLIKIQNPDLILLQEVTPEFLGPLVCELPEWTIRHNNSGPVMLFRSKDQGGRLEIKEHLFLPKIAEIPINGNIVKADMGGCQSALFALNWLPIRVNNVHTRFHDTPEKHETYYQNLLTKEPDDTITLVAGDTNSRVAPKDDSQLQNIITGVVPMCFNNICQVAENIQMTDFPDAAFSRGEDGKIRQIDRHILDYRTGEIFKEEMGEQNRIAPKWHQFRMLMSLGDAHSPKDKIEGKNVFEYQAHLAQYLPNLNVKVLVRKAAKDNNERGFGFQFPAISYVYRCLKKALAEKFSDETSGFQSTYYDGSRTLPPTPLVFVSREKIAEFLEVINPILATIKPILDSIDQRIYNLEKSEKNPFKTSGKDKIRSLGRLRNEILCHIGEKPLSEIVSTWESRTFKKIEETGIVITNSEIMAEKRNKFVGTIFYRKPPPPSDTENCIANLKKMSDQNYPVEAVRDNSNIGM